MKVLVTGAKGLIGAAIVEKLSKFNFEIYALLNLKSKEKNSVIDNAIYKVFYADIGDAASVGKVSDIGEIDAVIHCAGLAHQFGNTAESDFRRINVRGTANIAELAVLVKANHFILISSVAVYGKISEISNKADKAEARGVSEDAACRPEDFYSRSKLDSEKAAKAICGENNINLTILRPATVIGEEDRGNVARLIKTIDNNRFFWIGSGENLKSLIYKEDVAEACRLVLNKKSSGGSENIEIFNVTAEALPMNDIVSEIYKHLQKKNPRFRLSPKILNPFFVLNRKTFRIGQIEKLQGTIVKWLADDVFSGHKIKEQYGFEPKTPVLEAIRREVENHQSAK